MNIFRLFESCVRLYHTVQTSSMFARLRSIDSRPFQKHDLQPLHTLPVYTLLPAAVSGITCTVILIVSVDTSGRFRYYMHNSSSIIVSVDNNSVFDKAALLTIDIRIRGKLLRMQLLVTVRRCSLPFLSIPPTEVIVLRPSTKPTTCESID